VRPIEQTHTETWTERATLIICTPNDTERRAFVNLGKVTKLIRVIWVIRVIKTYFEVLEEARPEL